MLAQAERASSEKLMRESFGHWRSRYKERCLQPTVSSQSRQLELEGSN